MILIRECSFLNDSHGGTGFLPPFLVDITPCRVTVTWGYFTSLDYTSKVLL